jgi:hypothetical protein
MKKSGPDGIDPKRIAGLLGINTAFVEQKLDELKANREYERIVEEGWQAAEFAVVAALPDAVKKSGPHGIDPDRLAGLLGINIAFVEQKLDELKASGAYARIVHAAGGNRGISAFWKGWYNATERADDNGERPRPVGQAGVIPASDVPLDLSAQLCRQCRDTLADLTDGHRPQS